MNTSEQRANDIVNYLYDEGDIDLTFFGHILGMVSADENDVSFEKSAEQRLSDAITLVDFLVSSGDFYVGQTMGKQDGKYIDVPLSGGLEEFRNEAMDIFAKEGIDGDNLIVFSWIKKKKIGKKAPPLPGHIIDLFR
ncbi:hypothetical protein FHT86_005576 [Rhizobium sp. BK313]|jgi:hypothetical protein|uniref:hypothetical protein n=1 Tax=Rhizobium sp. BK313 TaxID=2587081 RepID=UPI00105B9E00|nr:hypothetical protein [Rhizobium sp. BK313]MBB3457258.1 hypothetical protein [Rhizobium sp. BK313]